MANIETRPIPDGTPTVAWSARHRPDFKAGAIVNLRRQAAAAIREFGLDAILRDGLIRLKKLERHGAHAQAPHRRVEALIREYHDRPGVTT
jgi:hypothetical protein